MQFTSFQEVVTYMESFTNLEKQTDHYTTRTYRLDRMHAILSYIGNPELSFKKIHLAGSKGKGSTASYLASGLTSLGYKTGLYVSPHLVDYRERFTQSGTFFPDSQLIEAGNELRCRLEGFSFSDQWGETYPTTFELFTSFAYLLFSLSGCQWAVIETGLGGRLDATNTIIADATVLCPIEMEHTKILGDTLEKIAYEKSKIIKHKVPCFIGYQEPAVMEVFKKEAQQQQSPVTTLSEELLTYSYKITSGGEIVEYWWKDKTHERLTLSMMGKVQAQNCALALMVLRKLGLFGEHTADALQRNTLPGRFQKISDAPDIYLDGAHTSHSLQALLESFSSLHPSKENTIIYGALEDKDHTHMGSLVLDHFSKVIISRPGTFKKSDISLIEQQLRQLATTRPTEYDIRLIEDNGQALANAMANTPPGAAILVCGSFYLAGGVKTAYDTLRRDNVVKLA
ncbi:MAG TPA: bifunctional folylpolyglutamate synthase/dihydrofolate synthase [Spirochaetales bacterium]|nr:bifunctional folylpolyglutamate synthase/dihydrofolate synthase [Spirochaetales bacterium]